MLKRLKRDMRAAVNPEKAAFYPRFFKAGPGEYAEGDKFLGVTVPETRKIAKRYREMPFPEIRELLRDPIHELRMSALMILRLRFERNEDERAKIVRLYKANTKYINNWDLVDNSAPYILGPWLLARKDERALLYDFAQSKILWRRRMAMVTTQHFIKHGELDDTLALAEILLHDEHDLIHKVVGWMLRELGQRDPAVEEKFLDKHATTMPRTMLRYAIERFAPSRRKHYMAR